MRTIAFISLVFCTLLIRAQQYSFQNYSFDPSLSLSSIDSVYAGEDELLLLDKDIHEFVLIDNALTEYVLEHKQVFVNSDKAIEENNKVYLPLSENREVLEEGCRIIKPSGEVRLLNKDNIQETTGDDEEEQFRYYAVDGLEKGSIIEFFYIYQRSARYTGTYVTFQSNTPKQRVEFDIISPEHLIFRSKSMNGMPDGVADTLDDGRNRLRFSAQHIPPIESEPFANLAANSMRVVYKLAENTFSGDNSMNSYAPIAQNVWDNCHASERDELKTIKKELKRLKLDDDSPLEERIRAIEHHLKYDFSSYDASDVRLTQIPFIVENQAYNQRGAVRYLCSMFDAAEIEHEVVLTNERDESFVDPEFECYCHLQEYLIYFPEIDAFLDPDANLYRMPIIDNAFQGNYGLFVSALQLGDVQSASARLEKIPVWTYDRSMSIMKISVALSDDQEEAVVDSEVTWTGQDAASYFQGLFSYVDEERKEELDEILQNMQIEGADVQSFEKINAGIEHVGKDPFTVKMSYSTPDLIEFAGDAIIVKVGLVIGPQAELYQEKERTQPVEQDHNRGYERTLRITIPEGMRCGNLDDLNFHIVSEEGSEPKASFISRYEVKGDIIEVRIEEYYRELHFSLDEYPAFARVINAAADFNKVKLVFKPS